MPTPQRPILPPAPPVDTQSVQLVTASQRRVDSVLCSRLKDIDISLGQPYTNHSSLGSSYTSFGSSSQAPYPSESSSPRVVDPLGFSSSRESETLHSTHSTAAPSYPPLPLDSEAPLAPRAGGPLPSLRLTPPSPTCARGRDNYPTVTSSYPLKRRRASPSSSTDHFRFGLAHQPASSPRSVPFSSEVKDMSFFTSPPNYLESTVEVEFGNEGVVDMVGCMVVG